MQRAWFQASALGALNASSPDNTAPRELACVRATEAAGSIILWFRHGVALKRYVRKRE